MVSNAFAHDNELNVRIAISPYLNVRIFEKFIINDEGELTVEDIKAKKITTVQLIIKNPEEEETQVAGVMTTSAVIGSDTIAAGEKEITIETTAVRETSKIFITPTVLTDKILTITEKVSCESFKVEITENTPDAINFDWWIVQTEDVSEDDCVADSRQQTADDSGQTADDGDEEEADDGEDTAGDSEGTGGSCDLEHLILCDTFDLCDGIGLYFYGGVCNAEPSESPSPQEAGQAGDSDEAVAPCVPDWGCYDWSPDPSTIESGETFTQTRECVDLNECGVDGGKPDEEREEVGVMEEKEEEGEEEE